MIDEKLSKRQLILGVILAVMYFLGLFSILLIRPIMEILNHVFIWQPEQQNRMALLLNGLIYIGVILGFRGSINKLSMISDNTGSVICYG